MSPANHVRSICQVVLHLVSWPSRTVAPLVVLSGGCSLILDFSDSAIPQDAAPDARFTQQECDFAEPNDSAATAHAITTADSGPAAICEATPGTADRDFYRFTVPAGTTTVTVAIMFEASKTGDLDLRLYDKTGAVVLASSVGVQGTEQIVCPGQAPLCNMNMPLAAGDYVFEVYPAIGGAANRYQFAVTLAP